MSYEIPKFPLGDIVEGGIDFFTDNFSFITQAISDFTESGYDGVVEFLTALPPSVVVIAITAIAIYLGGLKLGLFIEIGLAFCYNLGLWFPTIQTLTLVIVSTFITVSMGLPLGVLGALSKTFYRIIMPVLDFMQTMPAFVYLIPAIPFFGLGVVSAMFSTVIFSMPPAIRLTILGIREVPVDLIEAADAFGSTRMQKLFKLQLPVATTTIMAGINQTIMLALSMVVIAAMIGAQGLGGVVWKAIQRLEPGLGFEGGVAVVILAMVLDRITQKIGDKTKTS